MHSVRSWLGKPEGRETFEEVHMSTVNCGKPVCEEAAGQRGLREERWVFCSQGTRVSLTSMQEPLGSELSGLLRSPEQE